MSDLPPSYNESLKQHGPPFAGPPPMYGAVSGQAPPASHYPVYPSASPGYPQQTPGQGQYPPQQPAGQYPPQQPGYPSAGSSYQNHVVVSQNPSQSVVVVGGCPACRVGALEDDFTCPGVCCAIVCFPFGILCCLAWRQRRCAHCGAVFG